MKNLTMVGIFALMMLAPLAAATHATGCTPTSARPELINEIDAAGNEYYEEERCEGGQYGTDGNDHCLRQDPGRDLLGDDGAGLLPGIPHPAIHNEGFILSNGTWLYQESNPFGDTLQRGGTGLTGAWFPPGCDQTWTLSQFIESQTLPGGTGPCLLIDEDPINDETCTHGPDTIIF